jgi:RNA polymerase sigma-70 factor (ECF subfamily)
MRTVVAKEAMAMGIMAAEDAGPDESWADSFGRHLVGEYGPALNRYVRRLIPGDPFRAEDIVQETFLRAWRHSSTLARQPSARAWLFRVARNLTFDMYRRQAARPPEVAEDVSDLADHRAEEQLANVLHRTILVEALKGLSGPHRETLLHLHCRDRTHAETGRVLGIATGTVKSRHHYAAHELRRALLDRGVTGA